LLHLNQGDIDWNIVLRRMNQETDRCVALLRDPKIADMQGLAQASSKLIADIRSGSMQFPSLAKREGETQKAYSNRVADALLLVQMPSFARAETTLRAARMRDEMVRALVAAAQFRADNAHWPGQLSDLVPKYLAAVPKDLYSPSAAATVHYIQVEDGIFIYSVGFNRIGDGGLNDPAQKQDDVGEGIPPKPGEQGL
jgi:hypothetical protein